MVPDKRVKAVLNLKRLKLPAYPKVLRLEAEDYTDWSGDDALRILAVIDEETDLGPGIGRAVGTMKQLIRDSLRQHGVEVFPYVFIAKPSELAEPVTED
jgi:hypothetical protein